MPHDEPVLCVHYICDSTSTLRLHLGRGTLHADYSPEAKRAHLYSFWAQEIGRPVTLVGASLGGAAAIDFATQHPECVERLVLVDAQGFIEGLGPMGMMPRPVALAGGGGGNLSMSRDRFPAPLRTPLRGHLLVTQTYTRLCSTWELCCDLYATVDATTSPP
jgi:pimeloyl-ACP methyl ester carboxylesterase